MSRRLRISYRWSNKPEIIDLNWLLGAHIEFQSERGVGEERSANQGLMELAPHSVTNWHRWVQWLRAVEVVEDVLQVAPFALYRFENHGRIIPVTGGAYALALGRDAQLLVGLKEM